VVSLYLKIAYAITTAQSMQSAPTALQNLAICNVVAVPLLESATSSMTRISDRLRNSDIREIKTGEMSTSYLPTEIVDALREWLQAAKIRTGAVEIG
jgi:uncharacterized membrane protein